MHVLVDLDVFEWQVDSAIDDSPDTSHAGVQSCPAPGPNVPLILLAPLPSLLQMVDRLDAQMSVALVDEE